MTDTPRDRREPFDDGPTGRASGSNERLDAAVARSRSIGRTGGLGDTLELGDVQAEYGRIAAGSADSHGVESAHEGTTPTRAILSRRAPVAGPSADDEPPTAPARDDAPIEAVATDDVPSETTTAADGSPTERDDAPAPAPARTESTASAVVIASSSMLSPIEVEAESTNRSAPEPSTDGTASTTAAWRLVDTDPVPIVATAGAAGAVVAGAAGAAVAPDDADTEASESELGATSGADAGTHGGRPSRTIEVDRTSRPARPTRKRGSRHDERTRSDAADTAAPLTDEPAVASTDDVALGDDEERANDRTDLPTAAAVAAAPVGTETPVTTDTAVGTDENATATARTTVVDSDASEADRRTFAPLALSEESVELPSLPAEPLPRGNRAFGFILALFGTGVFAAAYVLAFAAVRALLTDHTDVLLTANDFIVTTPFILPVVAFGILFVLWALVAGRAGWGWYVLGGLVAAVVAFVAYHVGVALQLALNEGGFVPTEPFATLVDPAHLPGSLVAALVAREAFTWVGALIGIRGRRVTARNERERTEYERRLADAERDERDERDERSARSTRTERRTRDSVSTAPDEPAAAVVPEIGPELGPDSGPERAGEPTVAAPADGDVAAHRDTPDHAERHRPDETDGPVAEADAGPTERSTSDRSTSDQVPTDHEGDDHEGDDHEDTGHATSEHAGTGRETGAEHDGTDHDGTDHDEERPRA